MKRYNETEALIIFKNLEDIQESLKEFKKNNYGASSKLYYLKKGKELLKVYNNPGHTDDYVNFNILKNIDTKTLVKHNRLLLINKKYSGFSMDKVIGTTYFNIRNIEIREILKSLIDVEKDMIKLSNSKIYADDLNIGNIIYNTKTKETKLIDVNSYIYIPDGNNENILSKNIFYLYSSILTALTNISYFKHTDIMYLNCIKEAVLGVSESNLNIYEFFNSFIEDLENYTDEEIVTVEDFGKVLRKSRDFY